MSVQVNHAIRDGDYRLVYIAAADGVYKLFVDTGELALMHPVAVGETGYMVGYGALSRANVPVPVSVELVLTPLKPTGYGYTNPKYVFRHYQPATGWREIQPPVPNVPWYGTRVNKFNKNKWVVWSIEQALEANTLLYVTDDAGATWTHVILDSPQPNMTVHSVYWSQHAPDFLWVGASSADNSGVGNTVLAYYGNPFTAMSRVDIEPAGSRHGRWLATAVMHDGTFYGQYERGGSLSRVSRKAAITSTGSIIYNNSAPGTYIPRNSVALNPGTSAAVLVFTNGAQTYETKNIFRQDNYLVGDLVDTGLTTTTTHAATTIDGRVFLGGSNNGVREVLNPLSAPSVSVVHAAGNVVQAIASDAQSGTLVAVMSFKLAADEIYIFDGATWQTFIVNETLVDTNWINYSTVEVVTG